MILAEVVLRVREIVAPLGRRVGGTAAFAAANQANADIELPHAWVVPMIETATPKTDMGDYQRVTERFGIVVAVDNSLDPRHGRGMSPQDLIKDIRQGLFDALMDWSPVQNASDFQFVRGVHLDMTATTANRQGRLWHQFEFSCAYMIGPGQPKFPDVMDKLRHLWIGFAPDIGVGHEADYIDILEGKEVVLYVGAPTDVPGDPRSGDMFFHGKPLIYVQAE